MAQVVSTLNALSDKVQVSFHSPGDVRMVLRDAYYLLQRWRQADHSSSDKVCMEGEVPELLEGGGYPSALNSIIGQSRTIG